MLHRKLHVLHRAGGSGDHEHCGVSPLIPGAQQKETDRDYVSIHIARLAELVLAPHAGADEERR